MANLTPHQTHLRHIFDDFHAPFAYDVSWDRLLRHSPSLFATAMHLTGLPNSRLTLPPKTIALVNLAVSASSTRNFVPHIHRHIRAALHHGACGEEVIEVLGLVGAVGVSQVSTSVSVLSEVVREQTGRGLEPEADGALQVDTLELKDELEARTGFWDEGLQVLARMDPTFLALYAELHGVGREWVDNDEAEAVEEETKELLEEKTKRLIYLAAYASAHQSDRAKIKGCMKGVLKAGGTPGEMMEVLELASLGGLRTLDVGLEALDQELQAKRRSVGESGAPCLPHEEDLENWAVDGHRRSVS